MRSRKDLLLSVLLIGVSGAAMWAAFPDQGIWPLSFLSLFILFWVVRSSRVWWGAALAALWAMVFFLPHISWMNIATNRTYIAWILLALAQAFFLGVWGAMYSATSSWRWARTWWGELLVVAILWVGIEQLRARVPLGGFPWAKLPYMLVDTPLLGLAPLGGEVLVSAAMVTVVVLAIHSWSAVKQSGRRRLLLALGAAALFLIPGLFRLPTAPQAGTLNVLVIQGNVEIPMQDSYAEEGHVTQNHLNQTLKALQEGAKPDVVIWGEDAVDRDPASSEITQQMVLDAVEASGVPLIAGYQEFGEGERFNWYGAWGADGTHQEQRYGKQHPVPWGEFVPWRSVSEFLAVEAAGISVDMVAVDNPGLLSVELTDGRAIPFAVGICFEAGDEQIIAEGVQLGGQAILIPTNNSHFRDSAESTQQLQMTRFRAAEFSRASVQVSTNGVSAVVLPNGRIEFASGKQEAAFIEAELPLRTSLTPAAQLGIRLPLEMIALALVLGSAALLTSLSRWMREKRSRKTRVMQPL